MQPPTTGAHFQKFVCALQWVKQVILNFSDLVTPLHVCLELIYGPSEKRAKRAV